jgi:hypothetical protein
MPVHELKPDAIRSTKLIPITGNDAGRRLTPLSNQASPVRGGSNHCLSDRVQVASS